MTQMTTKRTTHDAIGKMLLAGLVGSVMVGSLAFAQPPRRGGGDGELRHPGGGRGDGRLVEFLELTEEQQEAWRSIQEANHDAIVGVMEQVRDNRAALEEAIEAEDALRVGELTLEGRRLHAQVEAAQEALRSELEAVLSAEQLERWEAFRAAREDGPRFRRRGPRGPGRGPGPGAGA